MVMKIFCLLILAWEVKATENVSTDPTQLVEKFGEVESAENEKMWRAGEMSDANESGQMESGETARKTPKKRLQGPAMPRFVLLYYPNRKQKQGLYISYHWRFSTGQHLALRPASLKKDWKRVFQEHEEKRGHLYNSPTWTCMEAQRAHEDDLIFAGCHDGGNQKFWFEAWGDDKKKGATHIHIGGNAKSRRRHACVDMGGNRLYIHTCHNGDNQRWVKKWVTTTTSTTKIPTTVEVSMITSSFPEKISWTIEDVTDKKLKPVPNCNGKVYSTWYAEHKTGCKLIRGRRYKITCEDTKYKEGWADGYLKIGKHHICKDFNWDQKKSFKIVMYP